MHKVTELLVPYPFYMVWHSGLVDLHPCFIPSKTILLTMYRSHRNVVLFFFSSRNSTNPRDETLIFLFIFERHDPSDDLRKGSVMSYDLRIWTCVFIVSMNCVGTIALHNQHMGTQLHYIIYM